MTIKYPANRQEVVDRVNADIQNALPSSEPFLRNSYLHALAIGYAGGIYDAYKVIEGVQEQVCMPDTATGEFADRWASFKGIFRNAATQSTGYITITGTAGTIIPSGTILQSDDNQQFSTQASYTIASQSISISNLTRSGSLVTAVTVSEHHFSTGNTVTISGATPTDYNGSKQIVVTSANSFTYDISTTPSTPASGTILATLIYVSALIKSIGYGSATNFASGSELFFSTVIPSVDVSAFVQYYGLTGGNDLESDSDFRKRYLYAYQYPVSYFNVPQIVDKCKEINGVTRVFVEECTPDVGQVTVYCMRDNDANPIPSPAQIAIIKARLLTIKPAHVDPADVIVSAPTPKAINFKFSVLEPNTSEMQTAIIASLQAFFAETPIVSQSLSKNSYASAIYYTADPATGNFVTNFVLAYPLGDILISDGEIAILGTVTF